MLYTVVPLEKIYHNTSEKKENKVESKDENMEYKDISLKYGRARARREGNKYVVEHIESTDMSDYLRDDIYPGAIINETTEFDMTC